MHYEDTGFAVSTLMILLTVTRCGETSASKRCRKYARWEVERRQGQAVLLRLEFTQEHKSLSPW